MVLTSLHHFFQITILRHIKCLIYHKISCTTSPPAMGHTSPLMSPKSRNVDLVPDGGQPPKEVTVL